jgi:HAD superfamily hydrolase (TIGR01549 family)
VPRKTVQALSGRNIRCILFDLGNTLWEHNNKQTLQKAEQAANLHVVTQLKKLFPPETLPTHDLGLLGGLFRIAVERETHRLGIANWEDEPDFALATMHAIQRLHLPEVDRATATKLFEALRVRIPVSRHLFKDTLSTLETLKKRGFLLGIVTNRQYGGEPFMEDLQELGLLDYFDARHIAISADLGIRKPAPAIFLDVLDKCGIPPEETAMVGDSLRADVAGANNLNMLAVWKPSPPLRTRAREELSPSTRHLSDNNLLSYGYAREEKKYRQILDNATPDLIIRHMRDLLSAFPEAGEA